MRATVTINASDYNAWARYGLTCNPFPQHGRAELAHMDRTLQLLDSDPIATVDDLERLLTERGASQEFIHLCRDQYRAGARIRFEIEWPDEPGADLQATPAGLDKDTLKAAIFEEIAAAGAPSFKWDGAVGALADGLLASSATTEGELAEAAYAGGVNQYGAKMTSRKYAAAAARAFLRLKAGVI